MKIQSGGLTTAKKKATELSNVFTAMDFNSDVRVLCEDGSSLYLKNARHYLWVDDCGERWLFVFCEHMDDLVFPEEDLLEYTTIYGHMVLRPPIPPEEKEDTAEHNCICIRCRDTWAGAFTNDLQMCGECYSKYRQACTCKKCGVFKGGHTEDKPCRNCQT